MEQGFGGTTRSSLKPQEDTRPGIRHDVICTPSSRLQDVRFAQDSIIWVLTERPGQPVPRHPRLHPTPANTRLGISLCQGMALPCRVPRTYPCLGDLCASLLSPQGHLRISCLKPLLIFLTDAPCYAVQHTPDKTKRTQSAT